MREGPYPQVFFCGFEPKPAKCLKRRRKRPDKRRPGAPRRPGFKVDQGFSEAAKPPRDEEGSGDPAGYRSFSSTNSTCFRTLGSYFFSRSFSVDSFLFFVVV